MIELKTIKRRIVDIKINDIFHIFLFILAIPLAFIIKKRHPNFWLVCEDKFEARDNGFAFFQYMVTNHIEQEVFYAIDRNSPDYEKVNKIGKTISYGTLIHWIYYLAASKNISSQKGGKPNAAVCYLLEVSGALSNNRIFLQHGITKDDMSWLYYKNTKISLFICGAKPEYEFIKKVYGYPKNAVKYTGFARFDSLHINRTDKNLILVMPTWRNWFYLKSNNSNRKIADVSSSEYINKWNHFIQSPYLKEILNKYNLQLLFYPHRNMQPYLKLFKSSSSRVKLASREIYDVQDLLCKAAILITDYSSVFFDVVYMKKPVLFYQFDEKEYRERQYSRGYFDYLDNPFSNRFVKERDVLIALEEYVKNKFAVSERFIEGHRNFFPYYDTKNCERIYQEICILSKDKK